MPTLEWLNRTQAFTTAARVPYRLIKEVSARTVAARDEAGSSRPSVKNRLFENEGTGSWGWRGNNDAGHNQESKKEVNELLVVNNAFNIPKPKHLIQRIATNPGGGGFRFMMLGALVFDKHSRIHPDVRFATLAAFIWQQETGSAWRAATALAGTPYLGIHFQLDSYQSPQDGRESTISLIKSPKFACYLLFNGILGDKRPASGNVLTRDVLEALLALHAQTPEPAAPLLVFGEACRLGPERLKQANVTFRHIPYDVKARQS